MGKNTAQNVSISTADYNAWQDKKMTKNKTKKEKTNLKKKCCYNGTTMILKIIILNAFLLWLQLPLINPIEFIERTNERLDGCMNEWMSERAINAILLRAYTDAEKYNKTDENNNNMTKKRKIRKPNDIKNAVSLAKLTVNR